MPGRKKKRGKLATHLARTAPKKHMQMQQALELNIKGKDFVQIYEEMDLNSPDQARQLVESAMAFRVDKDDADYARGICLQRLEKMLEAAWPTDDEMWTICNPTNGQEFNDAWSHERMDTVLKILDRMMKIHGLVKRTPTVAVAAKGDVQVTVLDAFEKYLKNGNGNGRIIESNS